MILKETLGLTRCGANKLKSACKRGLDHLPGIHTSFGFAKVEQHVYQIRTRTVTYQAKCPRQSHLKLLTELINEADNIAFLVFNILQQRLELRLELSADARACDNLCEIEG